MRKIFALSLAAIALPVGLAAAKPNTGGGGGGGDCKYCHYHPIAGYFSCDTSTWGGRQGECTITYQLGGPICEEPEGPICFNGRPLPSPPPVIQ